jgi:hypothetical protein
MDMGGRERQTYLLCISALKQVPSLHLTSLTKKCKNKAINKFKMAAMRHNQVQGAFKHGTMGMGDWSPIFLSWIITMCFLSCFWLHLCTADLTLEAMFFKSCFSVTHWLHFIQFLWQLKGFRQSLGAVT